MKKYLFAATMLAAAVSSPAFADGNNQSADTETFTLGANNPPKCNLSSNGFTVNLPNNSLSNRDGFAVNSVSTDVANRLNNKNVVAWCTGNANTLQMYRTPFVATGTDGDKTEDGFNTAVIYDVTIEIDGAIRSPESTTNLEGTSDGKGRGPGVGGSESIGRFGPSGAGATVSFNAELDSAAVSDGSDGDAARDDFTTDTNRLIAGQYVSLLTIELTPGN